MRRVISREKDTLRFLPNFIDTYANLLLQVPAIRKEAITYEKRAVDMADNDIYRSKRAEFIENLEKNEVG